MAFESQSTIGPEGLATTIASLATQVSSIEKSQDLKVDALRRELVLETSATRAVSEEIRKEAQLANDGITREMENTIRLRAKASEERWTSHAAVHEREHHANTVADDARDKRLESMNAFRQQMSDMTLTYTTKESSDKAVGNLESRLFRLEEDTRRRFELGEATARDRFEKSHQDNRTAMRPLEDERTGRVAIVAAIALVGVILGIVIVVMNLISTAVV